MNKLYFIGGASGSGKTVVMPYLKKFLGDEEFDLRFIPIPFIKLKFETWALISRILWFGRILKTRRTVRLELNRAKNAANFLYKEAKQANVALVSHGMLNMFIEKHLKKPGYKRASKVKNGFFSIITLEFDTESDIKH